MSRDLTLKRIIEDTLTLAANVEDAETRSALLDLTSRYAWVAGLDITMLWIPDAVLSDFTSLLPPPGSM